jgi:hypothetical protein
VRLTILASLGVTIAMIGCGSSVILYGDGGDGGTGGVRPEPTTTSTTASTGGGGSGGAPLPSTGVTTGPGGLGGGGEICATAAEENTVDKAPADIVFIVDNSGSMSDEIEAVEQNINVNFANVISAAEIDYQVIMLTDRGPGSFDVCIGPPLSPTNDCDNPPVASTLFNHYDVLVQSHDSLCVALHTLVGVNGGGFFPDQHGQYPDGWLPLLRPNAIKFFIVITDDQSDCAYKGIPLVDTITTPQFPDQGKNTAVSFDIQLTNIAPEQFGTPVDRKYKFYSIAGVATNNPPSAPYSSDDPYVNAQCPSAVNAGPGYQWLSIGTGGYRFPVCEFGDYGPIFEQIANDVLVTTAIPCNITLPAEPVGEEFDLEALEVSFTSSPNGPPTSITQVMSVSDCTPGALEFYVEGNAMELCPDACALVSGPTVSDGEVNVDVRCK